jgi:hypothetical protein
VQKNGKIKRHRFCAMLRYTPTTSLIPNVNFYYRGIKFNADNESNNPAMQLAKIIEIPGYDCQINIMCKHAGNIIEFNRDHIKKGHVAEMRKMLVDCFRTLLDSLLKEIGSSYELTQKQLKLSNGFARLLWVYYLTLGDKADIENEEQLRKNISDYTDCIRFDLSDGINNYAITTRVASHTLIDMYKHDALWFVDYHDLDSESEINIAPSEYYPNFSKSKTLTAVRNSFPVLRHQRYGQIISFEQDYIQSPPLLAYRIAPVDAGLPEIDEYSFYLIIKYILVTCSIRIEKQEVDERYCPVFPAFRGPSGIMKWMDVLSVTAVPPNISDFEILLHRKWILSPFSLGYWKEFVQSSGEAERKKILEKWRARNPGGNSCDIDKIEKSKILPCHVQFMMERFILKNGSKRHIEEEIRKALWLYEEYILDLFMKYQPDFKDFKALPYFMDN